MIKFAADRNGRKILGFGLSRGNVDRLVEGKPIHVHLDEMGLAGAELFIFFGETEEAMEKTLIDGGMVTEETVVHVDPKLKS